MKGKKGITLNDMYPAVLTIILIGIVLGIGLFILASSQNAIANTSTTVTNETVDMVGGTGVLVATSDECGFSNFVVSLAANWSGGEEIAAGNYSIDDTGRIINLTDEYGTDDWNITYTYDGSGDATWCTSIDTASTGISGFATWIAVIVVVLAAAIVLGIVINSFGTKRSGV